MAAVIGIVSIIMLIVAGVTSATLGRILEDRLDRQRGTTTSTVAFWTHNLLVAQSTTPEAEHPVTAGRVVEGRSVPPGVLVIVASQSGDSTGVIVQATTSTIGQIR